MKLSEGMMRNEDVEENHKPVLYSSRKMVVGLTGILQTTVMVSLRWWDRELVSNLNEQEKEVDS